MSKVSKNAASGLEYIAVGETENPLRILVVLHGTGDNAEGIAPLAEKFAEHLPYTLILVPSGPVTFNELLPPEQLAEIKKVNPAFDAEKARNWSGASKTQVVDEESMLKVLEEIIPAPAMAITALVDDYKAKFWLSDKDVALYGFSAGGLMALYTAIGMEDEIAGVISHSGHFMGAPGTTSRPNVLMMVGDQELQPGYPMTDLFPASVDALRELGLKVEEHVCTDLGHSMNKEAFLKAVEYLKKSYGMVAAPKPAAPKTPKP